MKPAASVAASAQIARDTRMVRSMKSSFGSDARVGGFCRSRCSRKKSPVARVSPEQVYDARSYAQRWRERGTFSPAMKRKTALVEASFRGDVKAEKPLRSCTFARGLAIASWLDANFHSPRYLVGVLTRCTSSGLADLDKMRFDIDPRMRGSC